ncbi:MAG: ATP-dependent DNA helicase RecG [Mariprofundales bacterium]|nr:ATP-dependent DNA helicase RecG [Mariprofundales bacterium]
MLAGVGPQISRRLERSGLRHIGDLLLHIPKGYLDDRVITPVAQLVEGEQARVAGVVVRRHGHGIGRKMQVTITLDDGSGELVALHYFHAGFMMRDARLAEGGSITARGRVERWRGNWQMAHPEWQVSSAFVPGWLPLYRTVAGVGGVRLRGLITKALQLLPADATSPLDEYCSIDLLTALHHIHSGVVNGEQRQRARVRLCEEELLCYLTILRQQRKQIAAKGYRCSVKEGVAAVERHLPFSLTSAQQQAVAAIGADLEGGVRMHRLLQGDVGSGKTVVAALAVAQVVASGYQVAVMAPTETLAQQLLRTMGGMLAPMGCEPALLTGSTGVRSRRTLCSQLLDGELSCVVGTHALLSADISFARLGLVIVDEQHRFGVRQRWGLTEKGEHVHLLAMSATPIPRSLALALYGDMELTVMRGMPQGRRAVDTRLLAPSALPKLLAGVVRLIAAGARVYWIVPLIDDEEFSVDARVEFLRQQLPDIAIAGLHGQMRSKQKQDVLAGFAWGVVSLLVSTTVVEVGVDVAEAQLIVIERAEQYGLAQLHQLRGRVGRSSEQGYCVLLPSEEITAGGAIRLQRLTESSDGMELAEFDLQHRGGGDAIGSRQSGDPGFRLLDLAADGALIRHWHDNLPEATVTAEMVQFWRPLAVAGD